MQRWLANISVCVAILAYAPAHSAQQSPGRAVDAIASWIALDAPPGHEHHAAAVITRAMPGWRMDAMGNLVLERGSGLPRRVIACGLDRAGYVVSHITDDGFLRLHGAGSARRSTLWDQFHQGQRVRVIARRGVVPGVAGVPSIHLRRGNTGRDVPITVDDLWIDVGARSRAEVSALGIAILDPVSREWPTTVYADLVAGPGAAARAGCSAVASAARQIPASGQTIFVLSAQSAFNLTGLAAALARIGPVDSLTVVLPGLLTDTTSPAQTVVSEISRRTLDWPQGFHAGATNVLGIIPRFPGTLVESLSEDGIRRLHAAVAAAAGVAPPTGVASIFSVAHVPDSPARRALPNRDTLSTPGTLLASLADTYGVSGHEARVREAIRAALPTWARDRATVDTAGNLLVVLGPDRDTVVFVAHMDETGLEVTGISRDGTVSLRPRGGFFPSIYEGQPALVHFDGRKNTPLPGVFVPRMTPTTRQPAEITAWFGLDSASLAETGVVAGLSVTSPKRATRLSATRFTARSIDDRVGSTALILALRSIDPARLSRKIIFQWATREEIGLEGSGAAASAFGASISTVYAVDTFVSSDSPLETQRFAYAPIGNGAVVRALDNSSVTPASEIDRVVALGRSLAIPVQVGTTNGGNDGSAFTRFGAVDIPISWPARYSHSPVELIDLRDLVSLSRLIAALATH